MDFLMGLRGQDFVLVCSDTAAVQQIIVIKDDEDKLREIDSHKIMALSGDPGDRVQFSEYIIANTKLYCLRNSHTLTTDAVAAFTRNQLATALRKRVYQTNLLLAGWDEKGGASLHWMDYLGTMHKMNVAGTGYGSYFVLSMMDKLWHAGLSQADAIDLMCKGVAEVKRRLVVAPSKYQMKIVDKDGIRDVTPARLNAEPGNGGPAP